MVVVIILRFGCFDSGWVSITWVIVRNWLGILRLFLIVICLHFRLWNHQLIGVLIFLVASKSTHEPVPPVAHHLPRFQSFGRHRESHGLCLRHLASTLLLCCSLSLRLGTALLLRCVGVARFLLVLRGRGLVESLEPELLRGLLLLHLLFTLPHLLLHLVQLEPFRILVLLAHLLGARVALPLQHVLVYGSLRGLAVLVHARKVWVHAGLGVGDRGRKVGLLGGSVKVLCEADLRLAV
mmetsp:Transcript_12396/g.23498  ORF Transcript_12396/g.23498 Transcript_12396/m.23498 type:complete len:238 (+) Transcript_12396:762-1475(+)